MHRLTSHTVLLVLAALASACGGARTPVARPSPTTDRSAGGGTIVWPAGYEAGRRYPVVVMLPASNGSAEAMRRTYPAPQGVIVVVAAGVGTPGDYRTGAAWSATIARYERQLRADLGSLAARRVRTGPVVLAGFSMGGDLAWALAVRNPVLVAGAVVMGSRMSYRGQPREHAALRGHRFYVIVGKDDDRARRDGARAATRLLDDLGAAQRFREVDGLGHERAPAGVFAEALHFVLDR